MNKEHIVRIAGFVAAIILLSTLYFKFTGHPESVELFSKLGVEPWGRWATGILELIASLMLFVRRTSGLAALMGAGIMVGAIASHLLIIGIDTNGDGGDLFYMAIAVFVCCAFVVLNRIDDLKSLLGKK